MHLVVLFNLKEGASAEDYEHWARTTDVPTVKTLKSVDDFWVVRADSLFGSDQKPPYAYVEVILINDGELFGREAADETVQKVAGEFQSFADNPIFMICNRIA